MGLISYPFLSVSSDIRGFEISMFSSLFCPYSCLLRTIFPLSRCLYRERFRKRSFIAGVHTKSPILRIFEGPKTMGKLFGCKQEELSGRLKSAPKLAHISTVRKHGNFRLQFVNRCKLLVLDSVFELAKVSDRAE